MDLQKSSGPYIRDALGKKDYLDCYTQFASSPIGYNHPKMLEPEFQKRLAASSTNKIANSDVLTAEYAEWVETFSKAAGVASLPHYFWVEGGALAVENALKAAFDWKGKKNGIAGKRTDENSMKIIHFAEAFHGRSGYTLSLTNTDPAKTALFPKFPDWPRITNPKIAFPLEGANIETVKAAEEKATEEIIAACEKFPCEIAALIIEPIQGEGGDNHFRKEFFSLLKRLSEEHDFMLIFDEVQTGIGLTGKMWAFQHFGAEPDIVSMGKKIQVGGIMAGKRVEENEKNVFSVSSRINSTFGGNLADMVRAAKYLEIVEQERLVDNAAKVGEGLLVMLAELEEKFTISNVRGKGLMIAFDLPDAKYRDNLYSALFENGLLCLKSAQKGIRLRPPLNFSEDEAGMCAGIIEKSLLETRARR
jgi:L-lysine 6-transaminase